MVERRGKQETGLVEIYWGGLDKEQKNVSMLKHILVLSLFSPSSTPRCRLKCWYIVVSYMVLLGDVMTLMFSHRWLPRDTMTNRVSSEGQRHRRKM